ncbi:PASTA domain-containing protein [Mycobacterium sp. CPCC 205372]|uniref:PASTA domain-containing protein n=1 Tax=Mycobacterium hippophais TaxID=3016340 RepID=A0ABT4PRR3_9MYCO|nr:PASTA domain-containing protein [Mycobacterium hippophais]MCZ8379255.1 PASTA domain-containing protein [Mycobacterium hippophais]
MRIERIHVVTICSAILVAASGVAAPTALAQEPPEMPDVVDMTLDEAQAEVASAAGKPDLVLETQSVGGPKQEHLVENFWKVCWQSPEAGEPMSDDAWYGVGVVRAGDECYS